MTRIAVGGIQHETNTFAPTRADLQAFIDGGGWPSIQRGTAMLSGFVGANLPVAGAMAALTDAGAEIVPLLWANASPSAQVTREAFETLVGDLLARLQVAGPVDGVYLDLHGAMVCEHVDDGEGEILSRVRALIGPRVPLVASLDLHANLTRRMFEAADALAVYRTYPHVDMADTGARAVRRLLAIRARGQRPAGAFHAFDFLTAIPSQCTSIEPLRGLYQRLAQVEAESGCWLDFAPGFPMADFPECQMAAVAWSLGGDPQDAARALATLRAAVEAAEPDFRLTLWSAADAVAHADRVGRPGAPVVLADTQDNPGAGGNGDTTGLLQALVDARVAGAVLGLLIDPASARQAHTLGVGTVAEFSVGAVSGVPDQRPVRGRFRVERLGDGEVHCTGPMYRGIHSHLGPMALIRHVESGVALVLASNKSQAADQAMFRHVGVEPSACRVVALKSSVHFRADFAPIAQEVLVVQAPGPALADPADYPWQRLRPGMRLGPLGPAFMPGRLQDSPAGSGSAAA